MKLKIGNKELTVKFSFEPTLKGRLISKLASLQKDVKTEEENLLKVEDMMLVLPEMLLVGLQKYHKAEFGYDYDNNEGREDQMSKVFALMDDYFDEENADLMVLYNGLQEEMLQNSFLSSLFRKELAEANSKKANKKNEKN